MRERPINLRAHEVRGILDGRVTQVRRPVPATWRTFLIEHIGPLGSENDPDQWGFEDGDGIIYTLAHGIPSPFGERGDRLWVRERALYWTGGAGGTSDVVYFDDPEVPSLLRDREAIAQASVPGVGNWRWRPSIHMPRWASRLTLEITDVRVQRVQDATGEDIHAEGIHAIRIPMFGEVVTVFGHDDPAASACSEVPSEAFRRTWDAFYAKRGAAWDANPWTWVVSFDVEVKR